MVRRLVFICSPLSTNGSNSDYTWQTAVDSEESNSESQLYEHTIFGENEDAPESFFPLTLQSENSRRATQSARRGSWISSKPQRSNAFSQYETQETQETTQPSGRSSFGAYPLYTFSVRTLVPLASVVQLARGRSPQPVKVSIVAAILETQGPDIISIKKGVTAGSKVARLQLMLGDEDSAFLTLTAWRETAEKWGGITDAVGAKKGDVVHLENVSAQFKDDAVTLTASPYLISKMTICYRTIPHSHEGKELRPDLDLAPNDAAVQKVVTIVKWFQGMSVDQNAPIGTDFRG